MHMISVGQLLEEGVTSYPEGCRFDINNDGAHFFCYYNDIQDIELEAFREEGFECGYFEYENIIFPLFKFGILPWADAPYTVHLSNNLESLEPFKAMDKSVGMKLTVYLIEASTGIIKALRVIGLMNDFTKSLISAVERQQSKSFEGFEENLRTAYKEYSVEEMVQRATILSKI